MQLKIMKNTHSSGPSCMTATQGFLSFIFTIKIRFSTWKTRKEKKGLGYRVYHSSLIKQIQYSNKSVSPLRLSNRQVRQKKRSTKWINNSQFNIHLGVKWNPVLPAGTKLTMAYIMIWDGGVQNYIEWVRRQTSNLLVNFKVALS